MTLDAMLEELWTRIMFETIELDSDTKYIVRGVVKSVIDDMQQTDRSTDEG